MKKLTIADVQKRSLDVLSYIDEICRINDLKYSIFYGSLIGVERHSGFIPWDDDIDIVMLRDDYDQLMKLLSEESSKFKLLSFETSNNYRYPFAKVVDTTTTAKTKQFFGYEDPNFGVFVDIFPIDGIPKTKEEQDEYQLECETYRINMMDTLGLAYARSYSLVKSLGKLFFKLPYHKRLKKIGDDNFWRAKYNEATRRYDIKQSDYCGYLEFININWGVFPTNWFKEFEDVEFEGRKFQAIKNRRDFLTLRYGNYMELPPVEERITHHPYSFYFKD